MHLDKIHCKKGGEEKGGKTEIESKQLNFDSCAIVMESTVKSQLNSRNHAALKRVSPRLQ